MFSRDTHQSFGLLRAAMVLTCAFVLAVLTWGCDDEDRFESRLEEAKMAIDGANYGKAVSILTDLAQTGEVQEVLASAYAGQAGIDTFVILSGVDTGDSDGNDGSIDIIGTMLGQGDANALTCAVVDEKLALMAKAIAALTAAAGNDPAALSEDGQIRLAIYGFTDFVLVLGDILCFNYGAIVDPAYTVTLTEAWIKSLVTNHGVDFNTIGVDAEQLASINRDIAYVAQGAAALGAGNDLAEEFSAFLADIDGDADGNVSEAEFRAFLINL